MASKPVEFSAGGRNFLYRRMGGIEGGEYAVMILNELGPTLESVASRVDADMSKEDIFVLVFAAVTKGLTPKFYKQIRDVFISRCEFEIEADKWPKLKDHFDRIFEDDYAAQVSWFKSCFVGEFKSFLGIASELAGVKFSAKDKSQ